VQLSEQTLENELRTKMISFPEIFNNIVILNFCYDL